MAPARDRVGGRQRRARHDFQVPLVHQAQQRRTARHELARLLQALGDDAVERRAHRGAVQVEPRAIARDARLLDVLFGHAFARLRFVELALRHDAAERFQTLALRGQQRELRVEPFERGLVVPQREREAIGSDARDGVAAFHRGAGLGDPGKRAADFAGDARVVAAHYRSSRREARAEVLRLHGGDDHGHGRRVRGYRRGGQYSARAPTRAIPDANGSYGFHGLFR